jgi:tetratricopeptide (TPR) repeat protein
MLRKIEEGLCVWTQQQLMQAVQAAATAFEQGQLASAKAQCEAVLAEALGEPNASQIMALVLMREDKAEAAVAHLRNAKQSMPNHPPILNMLGVALGLTGNRTAAREEFVKVKSLAPDYLDARFNLAQLEMDENEYPQALSEYNGILTAEPLNAEALAGRAKVSLLLHHIDDAIEDAE